MEFEDKYFESEVREGFFVTSMMKRSWAAQLEILKDVDQVCRKYGIAYYADAGTLLEQYAIEVIFHGMMIWTYV